MGMYDSVFIDIDRLPISEEEKKLMGKGHEFQTKDFDNELKKYTINDDGRLMKTEYDQRWDPNEKSGLFALTGELGALVCENFRDVHVDFSGALYFYTHIGSYNKSVSPDWFGFIADFKSGELVEIKLIEKD